MQAQFNSKLGAKITVLEVNCIEPASAGVSRFSIWIPVNSILAPFPGFQDPPTNDGDMGKEGTQTGREKTK